MTAQQLLPLVTAAHGGDRFTVMSILRRESPKLELEHLRGHAAAPVLTSMQRAVDALVGMLADESRSTVRDVMKHVHAIELLRLDDRYGPHLVPEPTDDGSSGYANAQALSRL